MTKVIKNTHTEFYSDKFDATIASNLSLFLYAERLIIIAKDANGSILAVNDYPFQESQELHSILESDELVQACKSQEGSKIYVFSEDFCLVPGMLFESDSAAKYLHFATPIMDSVTFFHRGIENNSIVVLGAGPKSLLKIFKKHINAPEIIHGSTLALEYFLSDKSEMLNQELAISIEDGQIYVAGFSARELKFFNRFEVSNNQEFLKYTFSVLHQMAFDRMHCKITIIGNLKEIGVDQKILDQYFKNINLPEPKTTQTYHPGAEEFKTTKKLAAFWTN
ncbi:hypothetical protein GCM10007049_20600 [Echinicola pacifica]|uniref:DUF3822 family protein n=1 Tax=Echinicola pacifica TaxID=346377 RepID=A0A918PYR4_9BACT|nr:DUF3822 family protein [Echinicola pacifica]GGZ27637.1 hypothetical protein GCM10007049_20600 [Echinicola pacifica]